MLADEVVLGLRENLVEVVFAEPLQLDADWEPPLGDGEGKGERGMLEGRVRRATSSRTRLTVFNAEIDK